jgi:hypothetical protein
VAFGGSLFTSSGHRSSISSRIWVGDGFDAFEIENFLVDALDLSRVDDPAIEDARLVAGFFWSLRTVLRRVRQGAFVLEHLSKIAAVDPAAAGRGNKNALKHGRYTAETIAWRRSIADLLRIARRLV